MKIYHNTASVVFLAEFSNELEYINFVRRFENHECIVKQEIRTTCSDKVEAIFEMSVDSYMKLKEES